MLKLFAFPGYCYLFLGFPYFSLRLPLLFLCVRKFLFFLQFRLPVLVSSSSIINLKHEENGESKIKEKEDATLITVAGGYPWRHYIDVKF